MADKEDKSIFGHFTRHSRSARVARAGDRPSSASEESSISESEVARMNVRARDALASVWSKELGVPGKHR